MNDETNNDNFFGDDLPETTDAPNTTVRMIKTFKELMAAQEELDQLSEVVKGLGSKISKIKTETFPDILREMGTEIWRDPESGITVTLETAVNSSLPKDQDKRNEVLDALRLIGINEILGEEYNVTFIPNDRRSAILRRLLGIQEIVRDVVEVEGEQPVPRLSNEEAAAIEDFRAKFELGAMPAEEKLGVHPSRLASWLKKKIADGFGTQITDAGIWHGKAAKVEKPKEKKSKKAGA